MKRSSVRLSGAVAGLFLSGIALAVPSGVLSPEAHRLSALMIGVVIFWITEPVPLWATSLLGSVLCVLGGIIPAPVVLQAFTDPILFLFIGSFLLAKAMHLHGLDNRVAHALLTHRWIGGDSHRTLWAFGIVAWFLAMWLGITTTVAMLFPAALVVARAAEKSDSRYAVALLLMLPYAASAGAMASPVGTPPNLIGIAFMQDLLGQKIEFLRWMIVGLPTALALLAVRYGIVLLLFHPPTRGASQKLVHLHEGFHAPGLWTQAERTTFICFGAAVFLWVLGLPPGWVAMVAAGVLFILPSGLPSRERILRPKDALRIDWGTIFLFGGGIALGRAVFDTGLGAFLGDLWLKPLIGGHFHLLTLAVTAAAVLMSEIASNTAAANIIIPLALSTAGGDMALSLAFAATLGTSLGFMLPVSTPANAMVYGSGLLRLKDMVRAGILVDLAGIPIVWLAVHRLVPLVFG